jgi:hypothetical protein
MKTRGRIEPMPLGALLGRTALARPRDRVDRDTWGRAVGDRVAKRTEPVTLQNGVLFVRVASSVWAQELSLLAPTIISRLRAAGAPVSSLRFQVGEVAPFEPPRARIVEPRPPRELPAELARRLARIDDPELRRAIEEAASHLVEDDPGSTR